jgi:predicted Zn-dependent peptidase
MADMVWRPAFIDIDPEREVVLEEIAMYEDDPQDTVFDVLGEAVFGGHPLGRPIIGRAPVIRDTPVDAISAFHARRYVPGSVVVAAAGNVDHDRLLDALAVEGWFEAGAREWARAPVAPSPAYRGATRWEERDTAQTHIVFGTDTFPLRDPRRFAISILTNVFGGGMSSRLFQRVREELGLAYAIFAYKNFHQSSGQLGVYVGTQTASADQAVDAIRSEYDRIAREGLPADELEAGKLQLKGQIMLALESPMARMGRLAGFSLHDDPYRPLDRMLAEIDAVTADEIATVAAEFFPPDRQSVVRLGPSLSP